MHPRQVILRDTASAEGHSDLNQEDTQFAPKIKLPFFFFLFLTMLLNPFRPCEGSPIYQEEYRGSYVPKVVKRNWRCIQFLQVVAPDTPYVAAAGLNALYFLDTRFDPETAKHIKEQIEKALVPKRDGYTFIDEVFATAENKNSVTNETTFVFDPVYARVLFARGFNRRNPELKLPEHERTGDWLVTYDLHKIFTDSK